MSTTSITRKTPSPRVITHSYYAVFIDYGRKGLEAVTRPEFTRRDVVAMIRSGEYRDIGFIHFVHGTTCDDVTAELVAEAMDQQEAA